MASRALAFTLVCLALMCVAPGVHADLLELDDSNFQHVIDKNPLVLVMWYAPWCSGNCEALRNSMKEADEQLAQLNPPVITAQIDLESNEATKDKYGVRGAPNLKLFRNGKDEMFRGLRDAGGIVHYLTLLNGPAVKPTTSLAQYQEYTNNERMLHMVVCFFKDGGDAAQTIQDLAEKLRQDFTFLSIMPGAEPKLFEEFGVKPGDQAIFMYKSWDKADKPRFTGEWKADAIEKYIRSHSHPPLAVFGTTWAKYLNGHDLPIAKIILDFHEEDGSDVATRFPEEHKIAMYMTTVPNFQNKFTFALSPLSKQRGGMNNMGYNDHDKLIMVSQWGQKQKYIYEEKSWNMDGVGQWLANVGAGRVDAWVKSAPIPVQDPNSYVVDVVGKTFRNLVLTPEKDVMIEFYAPWCGHCKKLAPIYERLAKKFRKVDSVIIAKMDATANDWPEKEHFPVTGYPTIYFVKGGSKTIGVSKYKYARDYATMKKFIKQMAGIPFKFPKSKKKKAEEAAKQAEQATGTKKDDL